MFNKFVGWFGLAVDGFVLYLNYLVISAIMDIPTFEWVNLSFNILFILYVLESVWENVKRIRNV